MEVDCESRKKKEKRKFEKKEKIFSVDKVAKKVFPPLTGWSWSRDFLNSVLRCV
jgi:hypothetical protein